MELKHLWLPRVQNPRPSFFYDDGFCSFILTKDSDLTMVIILSLCNLKNHKLFAISPVENTGSHIFPFFYEAISFFLSFPYGLFYPFSWPLKDNMMWQNSQYSKVMRKRFKAGLMTNGTASQLEGQVQRQHWHRGLH